MITVHNDRHAGHHGRVEMYRGEWVPCVDVPARVDRVAEVLRARGLGPIVPPAPFDDTLLAHVHAPRYLEFLRTAWADWVALDPGNAGRDVLPSVWPVRGHRTDRAPENFSARVGLHAFDAGTPLTAGTWDAARGGAACAATAVAHVLAGQRAAFALTRPPGHHAGHDFFGGYCFVNHAAVAASLLRGHGLARVAVLDIDYHHGNGTQSIFYERGDVFYASLHGDPRTEYPFYLGHADETGAGAGSGCNLNLPMPRGTPFGVWDDALGTALAALAGFGAEAMVVSLGVDTYEGDPISAFRLREADYLRIGERLAAAGLPTVFVFEGGYAVDQLGTLTANVLDGFRQRAG